MVTAAEARVSSDHSVVVLASLGRDAAIVHQTLAVSGIACVTMHSIADLITGVRAGAGMVLITEESLTPEGVTELIAALGDQPSWSNVPIVLLLASDTPARGSGPHLAALTVARNVTVLERPIPAVTLVTGVQALLAARDRQYELRDLLARERAAREQAETATRIKDEFLAAVSHELRTPLGAILLWSQLLQTGRLTPAQTGDALHGITRSAETQSRLVEDLLDVSRMLMGKLRIDVEPRALGPILLAAEQVVRPTADAKGVRLGVQLVAHDDMVLADDDRIQQVFWNLLSNAVKFTPPGGTVRVEMVRERDQLVTTVTDTGQGIAADFLPHVFERFRQGSAGTARQTSGLGLGLSIVHQLVELHGGSVHAHSDGPGRGARFVVRLPAQ